MNLRDRNIAIRTEPSGDVDHRRRYIQMEGRFEPPERYPFGHSLKVVDRFDCFHLDNRHHLPASVLRDQDDVGIDSRDTGTDWTVLLSPGVDADIESTAKLRL